MEHYNVEGMSCAACVAHVEKAVRGVEGVTDVSVSLLTNSMQVSGDADAKAICEAVENAGYHAARRGAQNDAAFKIGEDDLTDRETPKLLKRLSLSVLFTDLNIGHSHITSVFSILS